MADTCICKGLFLNARNQKEWEFTSIRVNWFYSIWHHFHSFSDTIAFQKPQNFLVKYQVACSIKYLVVTVNSLRVRTMSYSPLYLSTQHNAWHRVMLCIEWVNEAALCGWLTGMQDRYPHHSSLMWKQRCRIEKRFAQVLCL